MTRRKECRRVLSLKLGEDCQYVLAKENEPDREIIVATMLFDIPTE